MVNILTAIDNLISNPHLNLNEFYSSREHIRSVIRINQQGDLLENYIIDLFANTIDTENLDERNRKIGDIFSWTGAQNHPPDLMLKGGDAIEVKKKENHGELQLNTSIPRSKLSVFDPLITEECRTCEEWVEKDIIYCIGTIPKNSNTLKSLWMVYGDCYAADNETYNSRKLAIDNAISPLCNAESNELGRINDVDPLKISDFRIRGM